uniref:Putative retroelement n=1 Tax=Saccharum spontaneum TaxID=62335 RepID=A0A678T549_SACSP|nr:putative retroelement [Saccharum spontaneum]
MLHPSEFPIKFKDYSNMSKYLGHKKLTLPSEEDSPRVNPLKEWLMEVKRSSEAIQIPLPSTTIPCSLRGTNLDALHNPTVRTSIMLEVLAKNLLGNMPLVLTNKLFKSLSSLFFECCGIARVMPMEINEIEVRLDFHIYVILDFNLLIGCPSEALFQVKPSHGSFNKELGETVVATPIPYPKSPMVKQHPNHDMFKEVKFISPIISHSCETEHPAPSLEPNPCPSGHPNIILDDGRESTLPLQDISPKKENFCAMDIFEPTLETKRRDSTYEHENFTFETPQVSCSLLKSLELISLSSTSFHKDHNHVSILVSKLFRRMVVDAYVY